MRQNHNSVYYVHMKPVVPKIIRVAGIIITALVIPMSILVLLALQGTGNTHQIVILLYVGWAIINFIAIPFMLLGFIIRYTIKTIIYLAVAHLALSLAVLALLFTDMVSGNVALLIIATIIALPSLLYIVGTVTHRKSVKQTQNSETPVQI